MARKCQGSPTNGQKKTGNLPHLCRFFADLGSPPCLRTTPLVRDEHWMFNNPASERKKSGRWQRGRGQDGRMNNRGAACTQHDREGTPTDRQTARRRGAASADSPARSTCTSGLPGAQPVGPPRPQQHQPHARLVPVVVKIRIKGFF